MLSHAHQPILVYDSGVFAGRFMMHGAVRSLCSKQTILIYGSQAVSDADRSISCLRELSVFCTRKGVNCDGTR